MTSVVKPCLNLILQLCCFDDELECLDPDSIIVDVGTFAAIRLIPTRTGDILVRILKHGRVEDLFPADYIVKGEGCIRAYSLKNSAYFGKYDFEVYVDEEFSYLLQRVDWLDKGATGRDSMTTLVAENNSLRTGIFIKSPNGKVQEYTNDRVDFKIVDFDVVDDDGDGVFEPGSFVRVENIKIANVGIAFMKTTLMTGSIPCPAGISLSLGASRWIRPVGNLQVKAIPADSEVTLDGCLRGFIDVKSECVNFCAMETIYLTANLSELNMQSSIVSIEKMISISYPLHLEIVHCPSWIAPGSSAEISWRITNTSTKPITRPFATDICIHDDSNTLSLPDVSKYNEFTFLQPGESLTITESLHSLDTECLSTPLVSINLSLSTPQNEISEGIDLESRCIIVVERSVTVVKPFRFTRADILLIAHTETSKATILTWKHFIENLGMTMDVFNLGLYGSLNVNGVEVLQMYRGKNIVVMGDEFYSWGFGKKVATDYIDTDELARLATLGTKLLICDVEVRRTDEMRRWLSDIVHSNTGGETFTADELEGGESLWRRDVRQSLSKKRGRSTMLGNETNVIRRLSKQFPSRRFAIVRQDDSTLAIRESLYFDTRISVTISPTTDISPLTRYTFISNLPFSSRLSLLSSLFLDTTTNIEMAEYLTLSIAHDISNEQRHSDSSLLDQFLKFEPCRFDPTSIEFVAIILSSISNGCNQRKSGFTLSAEILGFLNAQYPAELVDAMILRLRWSRALSLDDIREKIAVSCGIDVADFGARVIHSGDIGSEVRQDGAISRRMTRKEIESNCSRFETTFAAHMHELIKFTPTARYSSS